MTWTKMGNKIPGILNEKTKAVLLSLVILLASCGDIETQSRSSTSPSRPEFSQTVAATDLLSGRLAGSTWSGLASQTDGSNWSVRVQFGFAGRSLAYYDSLNCRARWTLLESEATRATYGEEVIEGSGCIDTEIEISEVSGGRLRYRVWRVGGERVIANAILTVGISEVVREASLAGQVDSAGVVEPVDCGERPVRPRFPARPEGLSCSSSAIGKRLENCSVAGIAEFACGEALEGSDTRISTGALNGAACNAGTSVALGGQPSSGDLIGAALTGGLDNVGESTGGFLGGAIRLVAAGGKLAAVQSCERTVRLQCNPEMVLEPYRLELEVYEDCLASR